MDMHTYFNQIPSELNSIILSYSDTSDVINLQKIMNNWEGIYKLNYKYTTLNRKQKKLLSTDFNFLSDSIQYIGKESYFFRLYLSQRILDLPYEQLSKAVTEPKISTEVLYLRLIEYPRLIISDISNYELKQLYLNIKYLGMCQYNFIFNIHNLLLNNIDIDEYISTMFSLVVTETNSLRRPNWLHKDILNSLKKIYLDEDIKTEVLEKLSNLNNFVNNESLTILEKFVTS